jgi:broad specificity phosphatase PhoE
MALELYFLRHGQTQHSRENMFCGCGSEPGLTPEGVQMAKQFGEFYKNESWDAIFCSPLKRALQTAAPISDKIEVRDGLKEISFGLWEGKTIAEVKQEFSQSYLNWESNPNLYRPDEGELASDVLARSAAVINEIAENFSSGKVLIVSHKATIRIQICAFLGINIADYRSKLSCPVASLSKIVLTSKGPQLVTLADRDHLSLELRNLAGT